jgi:hypothetical protein
VVVTVFPEPTSDCVVKSNSSSSIIINAAVSSISVHPFFHALRLSGRTPSSAGGGAGPSLSFILTFRKIILVKDGVMSVTSDDCLFLAITFGWREHILWWVGETVAGTNVCF